MLDFDEANTRLLVTRRRGLFRQAGIGATLAATAGLGLSGSFKAQAATAPSDADILNFA